MRQRLGIVFLVGMVFLAVGFLLVFLQKHRANQNLLYSINNLRELSQFAELHTSTLTGPLKTDPEAKWKLAQDPKFKPTPLDKLREMGVQPHIPAGTIFNAALPPERRLSWVVPLLPTFNQSRQDTMGIVTQIDQAAAWDTEQNQIASQNPVFTLVSYANPPPLQPGLPAVTQYVGIGGVGLDAALLPLGDPRAGCFRYDTPTPFSAITDGLSQSILFGEVSQNLGPWIQGGPSTVRTLDISADARRPIGPGGQFGGNHFGGGLFAYADHSVRLLTERTNPTVLATMFTIAGGSGDTLPGE